MKPTHVIYHIWIKEGQLFFISYLRIGFPSMHREKKPSPYASRPDPKEKKEKKGDILKQENLLASLQSGSRTRELTTSMY